MSLEEALQFVIIIAHDAIIPLTHTAMNHGQPTIVISLHLSITNENWPATGGRTTCLPQTPP
jgi:hypothetical protein